MYKLGQFVKADYNGELIEGSISKVNEINGKVHYDIKSTQCGLYCGVPEHCVIG